MRDFLKTKLGATTCMNSLISRFISGDIYRLAQAIIILYMRYIYAQKVLIHESHALNILTTQGGHAPQKCLLVFSLYMILESQFKFERIKHKTWN